MIMMVGNNYEDNLQLCENRSEMVVFYYSVFGRKRFPYLYPLVPVNINLDYPPFFVWSPFTIG